VVHLWDIALVLYAEIDKRHVHVFGPYPSGVCAACGGYFAQVFLKEREALHELDVSFYTDCVNHSASQR
jgi:hypothetical protein